VKRVSQKPKFIDIGLAVFQRSHDFQVELLLCLGRITLMDLARLSTPRDPVPGLGGASPPASATGAEKRRPDPQRVVAIWVSQHGSQEVILSGRRRIIQLYSEVPRVEKPFYLWVSQRDRHLFSKQPEALSGRLVYQNATIKLYAF
jgi:hypothetical protein